MTVNYELIPDGRTINQDFHLAVVKCLQDAGSSHHNKASAHTALPTKQFLALMAALFTRLLHIP
jgi:hypothetical protein